MMWFLFLHRNKSVDARAAQEIEERAFDTVREIVSENYFFYVICFCDFFEFFVSPISEVSFGAFLGFRSFDYNELHSFEKCSYKLLICSVSYSDFMITMYKK
jgi:hypothetical protein